MGTRYPQGDRAALRVQRADRDGYATETIFDGLAENWQVPA